MRAIIWAAVSTKGQATDGKDSIQSQIRLARNLCEERGWQVVDVLTVPGHSRRYLDIHKLAEDAQKEGIDAFTRLLAHFDNQDFDILVVRDGDRFARTQALHAYIVERVIKNGAQIYSLSDGIVNDGNFRMFIAMGGYRAAGEIDNLQKKREQGYAARAKRGLPVNSKIVDSHKLIRDPDSGKIIDVVVDDSKRQEYLDLAELVLEGVAWKKIEREMYDRFGYGTDEGTPHQPHRYYRILYTPSFWGHIARHFKHKKKGKWVREPGHDIPDGIVVHYHKNEAMYTGELADRIKAELERRETIGGRRKPGTSRKLSGLVICGACGFNMSYSVKGSYVALRCMSMYEYSATRPNCTHRAHLNEKTAIQQIDTMLERILTDRGLHNLTAQETRPEDKTTTLDNVEQQIHDTKRQLLSMIGQQSKAPDNVQDAYNESIQNLGDRLDTLNQRKQTLQNEIAMTYSENRRFETALFDLETMRDNFWELDDNRINQILNSLLGAYRFVSFHGEVIGIALPTKHH